MNNIKPSTDGCFFSLVISCFSVMVSRYYLNGFSSCYHHYHHHHAESQKSSVLWRSPLVLLKEIGWKQVKELRTVGSVLGPRLLSVCHRGTQLSIGSLGPEVLYWAVNFALEQLADIMKASSWRSVCLIVTLLVSNWLHTIMKKHIDLPRTGE
jgi:hypothetical protein